METKTIKVSKENYEWLCELAGKLQAEEKRSVSIDEALFELRSSGKISDLAGSWKMSDKEASEFLNNLRKRWASWKKKYA